VTFSGLTSCWFLFVSKVCLASYNRGYCGSVNQNAHKRDEAKQKMSMVKDKDTRSQQTRDVEMLVQALFVAQLLKQPFFDEEPVNSPARKQLKPSG